MSVSKWPRLQHLDEQLPWLRIRHGFETRRDPRPSRVLGMIVQKHCCLAMVLPHPAHPAKWQHQDRLMYVVLLRNTKNFLPTAVLGLAARHPAGYIS